MSRKKLVASALGLMAVLIVASALCRFSQWTLVRSGVTENHIERDPLTISASENGRFSTGFSWKLHVDPNGKAILTIDTFPKSKKREFEIPKNKLDELRRALAQERFFELADTYGERVAD